MSNGDGKQDPQEVMKPASLFLCLACAPQNIEDNFK